MTSNLSEPFLRVSIKVSFSFCFFGIMQQTNEYFQSLTEWCDGLALHGFKISPWSRAYRMTAQYRTACIHIYLCSSLCHPQVIPEPHKLLRSWHTILCSQRLSQFSSQYNLTFFLLVSFRSIGRDWLLIMGW